MHTIVAMSNVFRLSIVSHIRMSDECSRKCIQHVHRTTKCANFSMQGYEASKWIHNPSHEYAHKSLTLRSNFHHVHPPQPSTLQSARFMSGVCVTNEW
jgi:hypothetical protein